MVGDLNQHCNSQDFNFKTFLLVKLLCGGLGQEKKHFGIKTQSHFGQGKRIILFFQGQGENSVRIFLKTPRKIFDTVSVTEKPGNYIF